MLVAAALVAMPGVARAQNPSPRPGQGFPTRAIRIELPDFKERPTNYDYFLAPTAPEELDRILRADIETFSEVVRLAGLRPK
jgi:hypothetical protein